LKPRCGSSTTADAAWVSHVVIDRNLITAQKPGIKPTPAAYAVLKRLDGVKYERA